MNRDAKSLLICDNTDKATIRHNSSCMWMRWCLVTNRYMAMKNGNFLLHTLRQLFPSHDNGLWEIVIFFLSILDQNLTKIIQGGVYLYTKPQSTSAQNSVVIHSFVHSELSSNNISCLWSVSFWAWPNRLRESPLVIWHPWIYFQHKSSSTLLCVWGGSRRAVHKSV